MSTVLVTGASGGIGLEYCRQLQARGEEVIAVCRTASPELQALGVRIEAGVELTSEAAIAGLVEPKYSTPSRVRRAAARTVSPAIIDRAYSVQCARRRNRARGVLVSALNVLPQAPQRYRGSPCAFPQRLQGA
jgi:NAD(P)-dependent dehydrogenase (short-subunit alcohol dehydrogenase family)